MGVPRFVGRVLSYNPQGRFVTSNTPCKVNGVAQQMARILGCGSARFIEMSTALCSSCFVRKSKGWFGVEPRVDLIQAKEPGILPDFSKTSIINLFVFRWGDA